jgi:hypothetical protein
MKTRHLDLPRQARDKRNETGQKERRFSLRREACAVDHARLALPGAVLLEGKVREYCPFPLIFWLARACPGKLQSGCVRCNAGLAITTRRCIRTQRTRHAHSVASWRATWKRSLRCTGAKRPFPFILSIEGRSFAKTGLGQA